MLSIVLPVYNEELILKVSILKVFDFCQQNLTEDWQIIIADNDSTDMTGAIGQALAKADNRIKYYKINERGKGLAVISAWQKFPSAIYIYMDADLSTDLKALPALIAGIKQDFDIVAGSRFLPDAEVKRSFFREIFSLGLRLILRVIFDLKAKDAPCGFKAVNQKVIDQIIPQIINHTWFFDTEMLILAERQGFKIKEIPISWHEHTHPGRASKVGAFRVAKDYLINIYRLYAK